MLRSLTHLLVAATLLLQPFAAHAAMTIAQGRAPAATSEPANPPCHAPATEAPDTKASDCCGTDLCRCAAACGMMLASSFTSGGSFPLAIPAGVDLPRTDPLPPHDQRLLRPPSIA